MASLRSLATHRVASERFDELRDALCGATSVDALLAAFAESPGDAPVTSRQRAIDRLFLGNRVEYIVDALEREAQSGGADAEFAGATAATIRTKSPTSLKLALAQVRAGKIPCIRRVHADRIPHSVAHYSRRGLL